LRNGADDFAIGFLAVNGTIWGFLPCREIGQAFLWAVLFASVVSAAQYLVGYARQSKGLSMGA
jgi:sulfite exporter TauE/SafE